MCCKSAARQGKNILSVVVPSSWYHMVHHSRYRRYEFDTGYEVPDRIYGIKAFTTQLRQTVVRVPRDKTCPSHRSSGPLAPSRSELIAAFGTTHYG